jgi:hypothetical protein
LALSNLGSIAEERNEFKKAKAYYKAALVATDKDIYSQKRLEKIKKNDWNGLEK